MIFLLYTFLTLNAGYCAEEFKFEVKTMTVEQNVTLTCPRQTSALYKETLYWICLISGNWPEFLGGTFNFKYDDVSKIPRIQTKQEPGEFLLHINDAQENDTGLYYCIKVRQLDFIFMNGTFLQVKGLVSNATVVINKPPSGPSHPENPETLQCSVLSGSNRKTCPVDNRVYWFKAGSDHSHPSLLYLQGSSEDDCEKSTEVPSTQKCFYNFSEISDDGTYYCAVAACGQILFGNGEKLEGAKVQVFYKLFHAPLCSALVISLLVISCLIYKIKKKICGCCSDTVPSISNNQSHQREENTLVYSAPAFNRNKANKGERRNLKTAPEETVYTDVKTFR